MNSENLLYGVRINMSKTEELRNYISQLFQASTDKAVIEKAAVVNNKIDELEAENKASKESYDKLLNDYKDVVLHSSFKPVNQTDKGADLSSTSFDPAKQLQAALESVLKENK